MATRLRLAVLLAFWPAVVSAQVSPFPSGVTPPIFGLATAVDGGGSFSPQLFGPQSCTVPAYSFTGATTSGYGLASSTACVVIGGTQKLGVSTSAVTLASGVTFDLGNSTSMSQGSANRIDIASGDSLYLVSGGLGVGVAPPASGNILASNRIISGTNVTGDSYLGSPYVGWLDRALVTSAVNGKVTFSTNDTTSGILSEQFTNNPTCATNCGTSPTLSGVDSSFTLTMGASGVPASGFIVTFNSAWAAAPQCTGAMAKTGMAVGKLPLTIVTDTTTMTVVTNGTAPATTDVYHFRCSLGQ